ncbi:excinuclease ABC subunit UvrB [Mycoplasmopsis felis]|uniref:excinuclease ABC subunit UvrB n=1 Tax=Mycoplasmopsis felis TaxID=33923 RepID=UPI002AF6C4D8|nr:excinuclease ABC subunit UvrB [Mycoplasmopsis felis]WQQ02544.1 excinuclease ABC subunit UvrB [Mycoplasmopsis felis]
MSLFKLKADYSPSGDQPQAIEYLVNGIKNGITNQTLVGVTGSGKTFAMANVIKEFDKPAIILSHNKTLAAQLYNELKSFFPDNAVEYYVSYFDYFRPEAYKVSEDLYIEKDSKVNQQIEIQRLSTINSLLTRKDVIVVASVSAIYGALNPMLYKESFFRFYKSQVITKKDFIYELIKIHYQRNDVSPEPGQFLVKGDLIFIRPADDEDKTIRISFYDNEIEEIAVVDSLTKKVITKETNYILVPGQAYATDINLYDEVVQKIEKELAERLQYFNSNNKLLEAQKLEPRIKQDIYELKEFKMCKGIENYSMYLDQRDFGQRPYTLLDYFPENSLMIIDESHQTLPQIKGMPETDKTRKINLIDNGYRLPSAAENRPLNYDEFNNSFNFQKIYVSATPSSEELEKSNGNVAHMYLRPTGLVDPEIIIKPTYGQIDDIYDTIISLRKTNEKSIIITLTKESSEKLSEYLITKGIKAIYLHSDFKTLERNEIIRKLRTNQAEVLIGINLLREGIDIPEVSQIMILDADVTGFLRSSTALIQIVGRCARNANGKAILYADKITPAIQECLDDNKKKRELQLAYNKKNNIIPKTIIKEIPESSYDEKIQNAIDALIKKKTINNSVLKEKEKLIEELTKQMNEAAKMRDYELAISFRDKILELEKVNKNV